MAPAPAPLLLTGDDVAPVPIALIILAHAKAQMSDGCLKGRPVFSAQALNWSWILVRPRFDVGVSDLFE